MPTKFSWTCPYCNRDSTVTDMNFSSAVHYFDDDNKYGSLGIKTAIVVCPSQECNEFTIQASLHKAHAKPGYQVLNAISSEAISEWSMRPNSFAKQFPDYVPKAIIDDYEESCLICYLSPKASATLSRRCLQGIIRDFHGVKKGNLIDEIKLIEDKIDPITWQAINAVRSIGNIGAHMEKNIDLIIDVEPEEAQLLIGLIEILIKDWYIVRHDRQMHLDSIIKIAKDKVERKNKK
jgi:hypothetical protein